MFFKAIFSLIVSAMEITVNDFMLMQPNYPRVTDSDKYYFQLAMRLADLCDGQRLLALQPEPVLLPRRGGRLRPVAFVHHDARAHVWHTATVLWPQCRLCGL